MNLCLNELNFERKLLAEITLLKLQHRHVVRESAGRLALTVLEGTMDGKGYQGKPKRQCINDIKQWS